MEKRLNVNIEEIEQYQEFRRKINNTPLENIIFYEKGEKLEIDENILERFKHIGLNNIDFITMGFYNNTCDKITEIYLTKENNKNE